MSTAPRSNQVVEVVRAEDIAGEVQQEVERVYEDKEPYSEEAEIGKELTQLANSRGGVSRIQVPRDVSRKQIVQAFQDAFELIGGVPRLAHWADRNPGDFYKLYLRLAPTAAQQQIEHGGQIRVQLVLPPNEHLDK